MKRLTNKKVAECLKNHTYTEYSKNEMLELQPTQEEIYCKLSKYEDIEDELGIDLITLFRVLKDWLNEAEAVKIIDAIKNKSKK